ncbi:hypothetical protein SDC9_198273 [bioreactor metagenome]|uniref:Uncharacterized protein n=1 Tax=bioreactor metagenome TaxID=1076179 RepID=A0A645IH67_9ZZZZ
MPREELDILFRCEIGQRVRARAKVEQAASFRLGGPLIGITVSVENNAFMVFNRITNDVRNRRVQILGFFEFVGKITQHIRNRGVQHDVRTGHGRRGPKHTELKLVTGERKRGSSVSVGCVFRQFR